LKLSSSKASDISYLLIGNFFIASSISIVHSPTFAAMALEGSHGLFFLVLIVLNMFMKGGSQKNEIIDVNLRL
jgi:hypothetical protein